MIVSMLDERLVDEDEIAEGCNVLVVGQRSVCLLLVCCPTPAVGLRENTTRTARVASCAGESPWYTEVRKVELSLIW